MYNEWIQGENSMWIITHNYNQYAVDCERTALNSTAIHGLPVKVEKRHFSVQVM